MWSRRAARTALLWWLVVAAPALQAVVLTQQGEGRIEGHPGFVATRTLTVDGARTQIHTVKRDLAGALAIETLVTLTDGQLTGFRQVSGDGSYQAVGRVRAGRLVLQVTRDGTLTTEELPLTPALQPVDAVPSFLARHWAALVGGASLDLSLMLPARGRTLALSVRLAARQQDAAGRCLVRFEAAPTNRLLQLLAEPTRFWFDCDSRELVRYEGPTPPVGTQEGGIVPPRGTLYWSAPAVAG